MSGIECENTNAAFVAAGNKTYFGIETDVHVTADNKFVIIHDDVTGRVSETDISVDESLYDDLRKVMLKSPRTGEKRADLVIPDLADYIKICKKYEKKAVLELKNRMQTEIIAEIVDIIKEEDYLENMIFISFSWDNVVDLRKMCPDNDVQFLISQYEDGLVEKLAENNINLDIYFPAVTPELVKAIHKNNLTINCWTCDTAEDAERLISYGVDYITTNILE